MRDLVLGIEGQDSRLGTRDLGLGTRNSELGIRESGLKTFKISKIYILNIEILKIVKILIIDTYVHVFVCLMWCVCALPSTVCIKLLTSLCSRWSFGTHIS